MTLPKALNPSRPIAIALILIALNCKPAVLHSQVTQGTNSGNTINKGLLLPRMTMEQRDSIVNPEEGLVIYNTTAKRPQFYNGTAWKYFDMIHHYIGEEFGGGIIFYIDASGEHGLVAAPDDQNASAKWGFFEQPAGANGKKIGTGQSNTDKIAKISIKPDIAARICSDLELNGFSDWFLPSLEELKLVYQNLKFKGIGNFANDEYWTSSETDFNNAWLINFRTGIPIESIVNKPIYVRAVRSF